MQWTIQGIWKKKYLHKDTIKDAAYSKWPTPKIVHYVVKKKKKIHHDVHMISYSGK